MSQQLSLFTETSLEKATPARAYADKALSRLARPTNQALNAFFSLDLPRMRRVASDLEFEHFVRGIVSALPTTNPNCGPLLALSIPEWGGLAKTTLRDVALHLAKDSGSLHCALCKHEHWICGDLELLRCLAREASSGGASTFAFTLANTPRLAVHVPDVIEWLVSSPFPEISGYGVEAARMVFRWRDEVQPSPETEARLQAILAANPGFRQSPDPQRLDDDELAPCDLDGDECE